MSILIDGYNLLHHSGLLPRRLGPGGLERARRALLGTLGGLLTPKEAAQTTVVFDANKSPPDGTPTERIQGIQIRYAVEYEEADELLEELIRREPTPKKLLVVSSDLRVQRAARRRRAHTESSETWFDSLKQRRQTPDIHSLPPENEKPDPISDEVDVEYWLRNFGFQPPEEK